MRALDITVEPKPENQRLARTEASKMRVYTSSLPGLLTIVLSGSGGMAALRIDADQAEDLARVLDDFIATEQDVDADYRFVE